MVSMSFLSSGISNPESKAESAKLFNFHFTPGVARTTQRQSHLGLHLSSDSMFTTYPLYYLSLDGA